MLFIIQRVQARGRRGSLQFFENLLRLVGEMCNLWPWGYEGFFLLGFTCVNARLLTIACVFWRHRQWTWWTAAAPPSLHIGTAAVGTRVTQTRRRRRAASPARRPVRAALITSTRPMGAPVLQRTSTKVRLHLQTHVVFTDTGHHWVIFFAQCYVIFKGYINLCGSMEMCGIW